MRKKKGLFLCLLLFLMIGGLTGCWTVEKKEDSTAGQAQEEETFVSEEAQEDSEISKKTEAGNDKEAEETAGSVDLDLTRLSTTMVFSEVSQMTMEPNAYEGKIVRMEGTMLSYHDVMTDCYQHACVVTDTTQCCMQGLEFVLGDGSAGPEEYPEDGESILLEGRFTVAEDQGVSYGILTDARLLGADE